MKFTEAMIAWNNDSDQIKVSPWPDTTGWSDDYDATVGACEIAIHDLTPDQQIAALFARFLTATLSAGIDVQAAHRAFLEIDEYRRSISPDIEGAECP